MNAQIAKLKEQAKEKIISHGAFGEREIYWEINVDKFAELIVQECAELNFRELGLSGSASFDVSRMIKQHFGVK